jgi:hypothetical protein
VLSALLKYPGIIAAMHVGTVPSDSCKMYILLTLPQHSQAKKVSCGKIPLTLTTPPKKKKKPNNLCTSDSEKLSMN